MRTRLAAIFVVIATVAGACGADLITTAARPGARALVSVATTFTTDAPTTTTVAPTSTTTTTTTVAPTTTTVVPTTTTTSTVAPDPTRTWVATARDHVTSLTPSVQPDGPLFAMPWLQPNPHQFGTPLTLMVTEGELGDDWVKVQLPIRPNGQEAWVSTEDYDISAVYTRAEVDLTTQRVRVWENGELIAETDAVVGGSSTPTPFGSFYVAASVDDYFGEPALVLSSFSEALETFSGALPVIAIHRTFNEGQESDHNVGSNGCVRIPPSTLRFLAENVPLGTPVDFVS